MTAAPEENHAAGSQVGEHLSSVTLGFRNLSFCIITCVVTVTTRVLTFQSGDIFPLWCFLLLNEPGTILFRHNTNIKTQNELDVFVELTLSRERCD